MVPLLLWFLLLIQSIWGQMPLSPQVNVQVKISSEPFPVANAQHLQNIVWTVLGKTTQETIYCVSETPVSQLRFVCTDCQQKNITDMVNVLNSAQDLTRSAGFPTISLKNVDANPNWTGATIKCQAAIGIDQYSDSLASTIDVRYLRNVHVVDSNGQGPVLISNAGYRFYVECNRAQDGSCQPGRRKTLRCAVQAHPPPTTYRWLKNGVATSGNGAEITIGTEMIGQSIQCSANNGLYAAEDMPTSQAVSIEPYTAARLTGDNFQALQSTTPFRSGNQIDMNAAIRLACQVEGNPRPIVFWKLRRSNGQVVDAPCPQGFEGTYQELPPNPASLAAGAIRLASFCELHISNYSYTGQYWCSACSYVSQGTPECSPGLDAPGNSVLNTQVQGPPMQSEEPPSVQRIGLHTAMVTVHYCADPAPKPPREVVFSVDQNDIQMGQTWQNFRFEGTTTNNTVPNCYFATLQISPVHDSDKSRQVVLKLSNVYGSRPINVPLEDLLGAGDGSSGNVPGWLIALLVIIGIGLFLVLLVIICMRRGMFCFNQVKTPQAQYPKDNLKTNMNINDPYSDDMPRSLFSSQSVEKPYDAAVNAAYCDSRISSV